MTQLLIKLTDGQERLLNQIARAENRDPEEICTEAVDRFLRERSPYSDVEPSDRYAALRKLIGLVPSGPADSSVRHDLRPGDPT